MEVLTLQLRPCLKPEIQPVRKFFFSVSYGVPCTFHQAVAVFFFFICKNIFVKDGCGPYRSFRTLICFFPTLGTHLQRSRHVCPSSNAAEEGGGEAPRDEAPLYAGSAPK